MSIIISSEQNIPQHNTGRDRVYDVRVRLFVCERKREGEGEKYCDYFS